MIRVWEDFAVIYLETGSMDAAYNLAFEETAFRNFDRREDYFILWQNANAVVIGRYQNTAAEVNLAFAAEHGVEIVRRMSGGGAVYHDLGNLNFSYITEAEKHPELDFGFFVQPLIRMLSKLGISAELSGRNDVTIQGRKISGNSQYMKDGRLLHHGTILLSYDPWFIQRVLTVSADKLSAKGIKSVQSRVTGINEYLDSPLSVDVFKSLLLQEFGIITVGTLSEYELENVQRLSCEKYRNRDWTFGRDRECSIVKQRRFDGVGSVCAEMEIDAGILKKVKFYGDFFALDDPDLLAEALAGTPFDAAALSMRLIPLSPEKHIVNLTAGRLIQLLFQ